MPAGEASSSVTLTVALLSVVTLDAVPLTVAVAVCSSKVLAVGVSVNVAVPVADSAAMLMLETLAVVNFTLFVSFCPPTATVTVLAKPKVLPPCTVAVTVTVVAPAASAMVVGLTLRSIRVGALSSLVTPIVSAVIVTPVAGAMAPPTVTV